jgi:CPA2 family monovalent cation:H+ antiporter-2
VLGKSVAAACVVLLLRYPLQHRAHGVGQPGADRRVLVHPGDAGHRAEAAAAEAQSLVVAGAILSIALNPFVFRPSRRRSAGCWRARTWRAS